MFARPLGDAPAALFGERAPARVLEGGDRVEERRAIARREGLLERVDHEPVVVHRQSDDLGAEASEDLQRPVVRRRLDEHPGAGPDELLGQEHEALERAARDDDSRGLDAMARRDPLAERPVAAARAVREDRRAVALDRRPRAIGELGDG